MSGILGATRAAGHDEGLGNSGSENAAASGDEAAASRSARKSGGADDSPNAPPALLGAPAPVSCSAACEAGPDVPTPESAPVNSSLRITPSADNTASCCAGDQSLAQLTLTAGRTPGSTRLPASSSA